MKLKIHQRKSDKNNTELYKKAVQFFADELLSVSKQNKLTLKIIIKKFKGTAKTESGNCAQNSRYNYTIEINKDKSFPNIISTLFHELIHVRQGMMGKLSMTSTGFVWNGKLYKSVDIVDYKELDKPWELLAYQGERELTHKFFKSMIKEEVKEYTE